MRLYLTSLLIAVAVECCLAVHHESGAEMSSDNGEFGYLLYLPRNLEAGETVEAYIETNVTESFTATLHFIHNYEDRHFMSRQLITGGSGPISITIPDVNYWYGRVKFTAEFEGTKEQFQDTEDNVYIGRQSQQATFIETDKPIYKPGQEVKFRIVTINSHFRPDVSNISKIFVESPNNIRLAQWNNVERPDGLVDLAFQLISEPTLGIYNIRAYIDDAWRSQHFRVDEYVLPKFEITFTAPNFILINAEEYAFQVCAKYTYGQPVRGSVSGQVGLTERYYGLYIPRLYSSFIPEEEGIEIQLRNPVDFAGELDQNGCLDVNMDVTVMRLNSTDTPFRRSRMMTRATVFEANTGNEFTATEEVTKLETLAMNFELKSPTYFKPSIPYQGRIQVIYPDESPGAGEAIIIDATTIDREMVFEEEFIADADGVVVFEIPFAVKNKSIQLNVRSRDFKPVNYSIGYALRQYRVYKPIRVFLLNPGYSPTGRYMQIQPVYDTLTVGDSQQIRVWYTSDDSSVSSQFKFKFVARNRLYEASAIAVGDVKRKRTVEEPIEVPPGELGSPDSFNTCPPGFMFGSGVKRCIRIPDPELPEESECERQAREADEKGGLGNFRPSCEENGDFSAQQCHGSTGHCWCVDEDGQEIEETTRGPTEEKVNCSALSQPEGPIEVPTEELDPRDDVIVVEPYQLPTPPPVVHVDPQELHEAVFTVKITASLSPEAGLVVHYISPEGEVVADTVELKINEAFENEVSLGFSDEEVLPGSETKLKVSAEPGSLCGVSIVDKSVYVLGGENKLTPKKLFAAFDLSKRKIYRKKMCISGEYYYWWNGRDIAGWRYYPSVPYHDSADAFNNARLLVMTNYDLEVAPCMQILFDVNEEISTDSREHSILPSEDKIRSYFPSTWLWTLTRVSENSAEMDLPVPHTITDWVANGFCTNVERGVGIAPTVTLRAFQPFFLSMSLPYSIIRTEKTPIKVSVFNYLKECLVVQVNLTETDDFELTGDAVQTVVVPSDEFAVVTYKVTASVLGEIPLQVNAESVSDERGLCGSYPVGAAGARDAVLRNLLVKPEGEPETVSQSAYFCLEEGDEPYQKQVVVDITENHVPGTAKGEITVTGDLVGNTLSNVEDLIRMPYGCGEQNLLSMVPNIVALQYLKSIGESSPEVEEQAKKFILSGYQRELNYRRDDSSYSAFGNSNPEGSTFLTAFVIRTYAHADKFVDIDEEDMNVTIDWLRGIQEKDGSFRTVGYLAHKAMKGGVNNNLTLAAYVVSTFLEAGYTVEDPTVARAFSYMNSQLDSLMDTYSATILAYAYALADMDEFDTVYALLEDMAIEEEGTKHWESNRDGLPSYTSYYQDSAKAQNVEMTAYVLRAIMIRDIPDALIVGSSIARWLVAQRNPRGGFSSTQDTVIGMTALAEFAMHGSGADADINVNMDFSGGESVEFEVNNGNRFTVQRGSFENFPAEVTIDAAGKGCVLYSVSGDYYIKKEKQTLDPFSLDIKTLIPIEPVRKRRQTTETEESDSCDVFTISISARYNGEDGASNMAIINFRPVSGFVFDKDSLDSLLTEYTILKRYEIMADTITFYFDEITKQGVEFEFDVTKEFDVEDAKPAFITILDYYENGLKVAEEFEFVCGRAPSQDLAESTTYTTPVSPSGFPSSTPTETPDFDECSVADICGGPEYECVNYPGTYECICAEGYTLDDAEVNCIAVPSCPVCISPDDDLPDNVNEVICSADIVQVMKFRADSSLRPLYDMVGGSAIGGRYYYDVEVDEACTCDVLVAGDRPIVIASRGQVRPSEGRWDDKIVLDDTVMVVFGENPFRKEVSKILRRC